MPTSIRRVVTGHDDLGKAVILSDGAAPNQKTRPVGNLTSTLLWVTDESPADASGGADRAARDIGVAPPARGSIFRIVEFPPSTESGPLDNAAMHKQMGLDPGAHSSLRHPASHRTRSIDYAIVLDGEIDMLLDASQAHLRAGDVVVQQATYHAWVNNGRKPCRIAFVLIDAEPPRQWTQGDLPPGAN